ncbi:Fc.00g082320.m01.CDS01 [Cosmosporella sp. VM-42]
MPAHSSPGCDAVHTPLVPLDSRLFANSNMASIAIEQQDLLRDTFLEAVQRREEAALASKGPTDRAIWISDDEESDLKDEDDVEDHVLDNSQSCCTISTAASNTDHLDSTGTKHSVTKSHAAVLTGTMPVLSPARAGDVRILSHESSLDFPIDPESN